MFTTKPAPRTLTPPAKAWRNYYRIYRVLNFARIGYVFPGIHGGPDAFPSKEIAEEHALTFVKACNPPGRVYVDYAGAFPEGDAPN